MEWISANWGNIIATGALLGYIVSGIIFLNTLKTNIDFLSKKLDRCEAEIAELRATIMRLLFRFYGKTEED